jgi:hypothetical protein
MFSGRDLITSEADALDLDKLDGLGLNFLLDRLSRIADRHDVALDGMGWSMSGEDQEKQGSRTIIWIHPRKHLVFK